MEEFLAYRSRPRYIYDPEPVPITTPPSKQPPLLTSIPAKDALDSPTITTSTTTRMDYTKASVSKPPKIDRSSKEPLFAPLRLMNQGLTCTIDSSLTALHACYLRHNIVFGVKLQTPQSSLGQALLRLFQARSLHGDEHENVLAVMSHLAQRSFWKMSSQLEATKSLMSLIKETKDDQSWKIFGFDKMVIDGVEPEEDHQGWACLDLGSRDQKPLPTLVNEFLLRYKMVPSGPRRYFVIVCSQPFQAEHIRETLELCNGLYKYWLVALTTSSSIISGHAIACVRNYVSGFSIVDDLSVPMFRGNDGPYSFKELVRIINGRLICSWIYELC